MSILWADDLVVKPPKNHIVQPTHRRIDWMVLLAWLGALGLSFFALAGVVHVAKWAWGLF